MTVAQRRTSSFRDRLPSHIFAPAKLGRRTYFPLGLLLLVVAMGLFGTGYDIPGLAGLRATENYALLSGLLMASYLIAQLTVPLVRADGGKPRRWMIRAHKLLGALGPAFLIVHSNTMGYGYLAALSGVFLGSMVLGLCNHETLGLKGKIPSFVWMISHVALSVALLALVGVHVYLVFAYK